MNLVKETLKLFKLNKKRDKWDSWLDDKYTWEYVKAIESSEKFKDIFEWEFVADFLSYVFYELEIPGQDSYDTKDAKEYIELLYRCLILNITDNFIIVPLEKTEISSMVNIDNSVFIINGNKEKKINELSRIIGLSEKESFFRFNHTEQSRSPNFFKYPLLVIKIKDYHDTVCKRADEIVFYAFNFLYVLYYAFVYPKNQKKEKLIFKKWEEEIPNRHIVIQTSGENWNHRPLVSQHNFHFDLDWLNKKEYQNNFLDLLKLLDFRLYRDDLTKRFFRAIRFFIRSLTVENFEGLSDSILYLNIAAECLLLKSQEERNKSRKVKGRLSRHGDLDELNTQDRKSIIEKMIKARGKYVHEGAGYKEFRDNDHKNETKLSEVDLFKKILAKLLSKSFIEIERCLNESKRLEKPLEDIWFETINS